MHTLVRSLSIGLLAVVSLAFLPPPTVRVVGAAPTQTASTPTIYLGGQLSEEALLALGATLASQPNALFLLDSPQLTPFLRRFLLHHRPLRLVPVGDFPEGQAGLTRRFGLTVEPIVPWPRSLPVCPLWQEEFPHPGRLVVCTSDDRAMLLRAAWLAALERSPLWCGRSADSARLVRYVRDQGIRELTCVGSKPLSLPDVRLRSLPRAQDVDQACHRATGHPSFEVAVLANPRDQGAERGAMSVLAPWLAARRGAALLLTNEGGTDVASKVDAATQLPALRRLDSLILLGNLRALPPWQRPNPIPEDKDKVIELDPLTPTQDSGQPVSYAVGRLFHQDRGAVLLMLARQQMLSQTQAPRRALVASNPGGGLGLLEAFSRNTALELANAGYQVTQRYGNALNGTVLREQMPLHEVILWEGHHNTLVHDWGFLTWDEPLPSSFVLLQSCLALMPEKVQPLLTRGAIAVVGTSTRTYSASGGAFSLAYFDALLYDGQSLGGSLRQAKNFLLAYAALKQKRLGSQARRTGANHRAAWAFSLWGDPTFRLPSPSCPAACSRPPIRHQVQGNEILVHLPTQWHPPITSDRFRTQIPANARLAGLIRNKTDSDSPVVPMIFVEVALPHLQPGVRPRLRSSLPSNQWVFLWDPRRQTGYLLAAPRTLQGPELRFRVESTPVRVVGRP